MMFKQKKIRISVTTITISLNFHNSINLYSYIDNSVNVMIHELREAFKGLFN